MKKNISVVPFYSSQLQNKFFGEGVIGRDNVYEPYRILKQILEQEYNIGTCDIIPLQKADVVLFFAHDYKKMWEAVSMQKKSVYISYEPPVVDSMHEHPVLETIRDLLGNVMTWDDDMAKEEGFFKFYPPVASQPPIEKIIFSQKKLIANISGNKHSIHPDELYTERIKAIRYFEAHCPRQFDLYGVGWDVNEYPSYRGTVDNKQETLRNYKFSLCYDNMKNVNGMVSEKIFDCFFANCIPIYLGTDNIEEYVPRSCFVDRRNFSSYDDLGLYLENMREDEYNRRIEAIGAYLKTKDFHKFSGEYFAQNLSEQIRMLSGPSTRGIRMRSALRLLWYFMLEKCNALKERAVRRGFSC